MLLHYPVPRHTQIIAVSKFKRNCQVPAKDLQKKEENLNLAALL